MNEQIQLEDGYTVRDLRHYSTENPQLMAQHVTTDPEYGQRTHNLWRMVIDGHRHRYLETLPFQDIGQPFTIVSKRGFMEPIEDGIGREFHSQLARLVPHARIVSHATHGIGSSAGQVSLRGLSQYGLDRIANEDLKFLHLLGGEERLILIGTSMGSVVLNKLLNINTALDKPVEVGGIVLNAPAIVEPPLARSAMLKGLLPHLLSDIPSELVAKTPRAELLQTLGHFAASRARLRDILPAGRHALDLLRGTSAADLASMLEAYASVSVIAGQKDTLAQTEMWRKMLPAYPSLRLHEVSKGHGMILKPKQNARKIARVLHMDGHIGSPIAGCSLTA